MSTDALVPVTVLGGYLGAGKTTVVNRVLDGAAQARIAVVVNDFGSVNIDGDLIRSRGANTIELANGCICCDLSGGMLPVMRQIAAAPPDHVLIEVSGVGDPTSVAAWGDHPGFCRGGVLVCADVETIQAKANGRWVADTVRHQLSAADALLLSKTDLVDAERARQVSEWLRALVPGAPVVDLQQVDPLLLLDVAPRDRAGDVGAAVPPHAHHTSVSLHCDDPVDRALLATRLEQLPDAVVRAKGILRTADAPDRRTVVHVVGRRVMWSDDGPWRVGSGSTMVLIAVPQAQEQLAPVVRSWSPLWRAD